MNAAESPAQSGGQRRREFVDAEPRRIAGNQRLLSKTRRNARKETGLTVETLGDRFYYEIASGKLVKVLIVVGDAYAIRPGCGRKRCRLQLLQILNRLARRRIRITARGGQFEQQGLDTGIDEMGRNLCAHHAGAEDGGLAYAQRLDRWHGRPAR